jgi:hypothetical protein
MEFRIHEDARAEWERVCERWGTDAARRWLRELCNWLRAHGGAPPEAVAHPGVPGGYWLLFGEVGVVYTLRESPLPARGWWDVVRLIRRWWRGRTSRVIFTRFDLPGFPGVREPLPH